MTIEKKLTDVVDSANKLTNTVNGKIQQIDNRITTYVNEIDNRIITSVKEMQNKTERALSGIYYFALNGNNRFSQYSITPKGNPSPYGMGWGNGLDNVFETELIPVVSGSDPKTRPQIVKELLDFMGFDSNSLYFSGSFNILRVKNISGKSSHKVWALHIPWQHVKRQNMTYMVYCRGHGFSFGPDETLNANKSNRHQWRLSRSYFYEGQAKGGYTHVDMWCSSIDAEMWIALPSVVAGIYPTDKKLPVLFNITDTVLTTHRAQYSAMHDRSGDYKYLD